LECLTNISAGAKEPKENINLDKTLQYDKVGKSVSENRIASFKDLVYPYFDISTMND
jgi:hypothetical protein